MLKETPWFCCIFLSWIPKSIILLSSTRPFYGITEFMKLDLSTGLFVATGESLLLGTPKETWLGNIWIYTNPWPGTSVSFSMFTYLYTLTETLVHILWFILANPVMQTSVICSPPFLQKETFTIHHPFTSLVSPRTHPEEVY